MPDKENACVAIDIAFLRNGGTYKMKKFKMRGSKWLIIVLVAITFASNMYPVLSISNVDTKTGVKPDFSVEIDNAITGNIFVTLTNSKNTSESRTEPLINGTAKFVNFVNDKSIYNIEITGMNAYEDFYDSNVSITESSISFTSANFNKKQFTITTNYDEEDLHGGTVTPNVIASYGDNTSITANANSGYQIKSFTVNGTPVPEAEGLEEYTEYFDYMNDNYTVHVKFVLKTWEVNFTFNADGMILEEDFIPTSDWGHISITEGPSPSFSVMANASHSISSVMINGENKVTESDSTLKIFENYVFNNIRENHQVTVGFTIDTFEIKASVTGSGSIMVNDNCFEETIQKVGYDGELSLKVVPDSANGGVIEAILIDGVDIIATGDVNYVENDEYSVYTFTDISHSQTMHVKFSQISETTQSESSIFSFNKDEAINDYMEDGIHVYILKNDATIDIMPNPPYRRIRINNEEGNGSVSRTITETTLISSIQVNTESNGSWIEGDSKSIILDIPILILIDKTPPVVADIPPMEWTNQDYTVRGTVTDAEPSSGLSRVVWSKEPLNEQQVLTETTNTAPISDTGEYSFSITEEQNDETFYVYAIDNADNVSTPKTINIKIDKTTPQITGFHFQKSEASAMSQVLNFLTFGTFSNDAIDVIVTASDNAGNASSGVKEITIYSDGMEVDTVIVETGKDFAKFTLTTDNFEENILSASVQDVAGNKSAQTNLFEENINTNAISDIISIKNEKPTVTIDRLNEPVYINGDEDWYNGNVDFNVTVETESVGIYSVEIKVNGKSIENDKDGKSINTNFYEEKTLQEIFAISTDANSVEGENTVEVIVVNNIGNEVTASTTVYIDTTNPEIVGFNITRENGDPLSQTLNFLSFGIFFNEKVKITVITDDGITSGIKAITLYAGDYEFVADSPKEITAVENGKFKAEFILPVTEITSEAKYLDVLLSALVIDNVGNITGKDAENPNGKPVSPNTANSNILDSNLMIETIPPTIDIEFPDAVYSADGKNWYSDDVLFNITARDEDSGIRSVEIKINGETIARDNDGKLVDANFYLHQTHEEIFNIHTNQGQRDKDGAYRLEVTVVDNAGNAHSESHIVYKDDDDPYITKYEFLPNTSDGITDTSEYIDVLEYGFYFKTEFTVNIHVGDPNPSSGFANVAYRLVSYENGMIHEEISGTEKPVNGVVAISIPRGFKGQIFVEVFDNVGNSSGEKTPQGFVIDHTPPTIDIVNNNETNHKDADGNKLYVTDMSFTVTISDYGSGIKEFGYSQSAEQDSFERKVVSVNNAGYKIGDILEDGWLITDMDVNLVTKVVKTFTFTTDDNDIFLTFDATDRSGNTTENVQTEKVTIDKTPPIINVAFRASESKNGNYYDTNRIADITVIERNFDPNLIIAEIVNTIGDVPSFTFTSISKTEHVAVIDFDEGDYTFDIHGTDLGNLSATVNFSGDNENLFFVDKTKPEVEEDFITFSNPATGNSFNTDMTATIKIIEHHFDPNSTNLKITRKAAGESHDTTDMVDVTEMMGGNRWESQGDVHTLSITFDFDAIYQIEIMPTDLAGNTADLRRSEIFEIDKTKPIVIAKNGQYVNEDDTEFLDIYPYHRREESAPTVEFYDLNLDYIRYVITAYIPDYSNGIRAPIVTPVRMYVEEDEGRTGIIRSNVFTLPEFTKDGVYAVELIAVDKAGNESIPNLNTYVRMVNSDVLAYISNSNLETKTGWYSIQYENGDTISKKPDDFSDIEIVVFANKDTDRNVVLRDNNGDENVIHLIPAKDNSMYGIGVYNYSLKGEYFQENFQDDIDKELHLSVKNEEYRIDLGRLHIDNVEPEATLPRELRSWYWYIGENKRTITITNISELLDETNSKVYNNGEEIDFVYSSEDGTLEFTLDKGWHDVGIVLSDIAGNTNNIKEKVNIHIGFFWLWAIIVLFITFVSTIGLIAMHNIKNKRKLEND